MKSFLILLLLITTTTFAEIRYVSKTGTDTPPYTSWETAADSIQKCINICNDGDTVVVANGVYKETLLIDTELTLLGSSMDSCIIDGTDLDGIPIFGNTDITLRATNFITIENFQILGRKYEPQTIIFYAKENGAYCKNLKLQNALTAITISDGDTKVENCIIFNTSIAIDLSSASNMDTMHTVNNLIISNKPNGIGINNGGGGGIHYIFNNVLLGLHEYLTTGLEFYSDRYSEVKNNLVYNYTGDNYYGSLIYHKAIIENNCFIQGKSRFSHVDNISIRKPSATILRNNIITSANRYGINASNDTLYTDYNLLWNNGIATTPLVKLGENTVYEDPMFVNDSVSAETMDYDFHLQAFSPAIDAGDPTILDKDGSRSDIGMYGGPLGESYTYKDLAPKTPRNLTALIDSGKIILNWIANTEADFYHYRVYRDTVPDFIYDTTKIIARITDKTFTDLFPPNKNLYYKITAIDNQYNQSPASEEVAVIVTSVKDEPKLIANDYKFYQNYPNPFNPSTTLSYRLKENSFVRLVIYDVKGERVTELVHKLQPKGYYEVKWDAKASGLSSGIYLFKIEIKNENNVPVFSDMIKSILLK